MAKKIARTVLALSELTPAAGRRSCRDIARLARRATGAVAVKPEATCSTGEFPAQKHRIVALNNAHGPQH